MIEPEIIERRLYYSDQAMLDFCLSLKVVLDDNPVKKGKPQRPVDKIAYASIVKSIEYYSKLIDEKREDVFEYYDYQKDIISRALSIIYKYRFVYLAMEVRTGKTLTALGICERLKAKNVLFVTKKKVIPTIYSDYELLAPKFFIEVVNYESLNKAMPVKWDVIVVDEAHSLGAFPKPSGRAVEIYELIKKVDPVVILMSGTPTPESYSQIYHQVYALKNNPFSLYSTFYKFAKKYVDIKQKKINGLYINDYRKAYDSVMEEMAPYMIKFSQKDAGFVNSINEQILSVTLNEKTYDIIDKLQKTLVIQGKSEVILADTAVKLMSKLHQLYSGTVKFESGSSMVIDNSKALFIKEYFDGQKIGIFYKFIAELSAIKQVFGDAITTNLEEFNSTDKSIALQIVSGREGISLREADALVYYNIDFSATSYWQSRDRMTTKVREESNIYWVFAAGGIEYKIYKAVTKKKDYTVSHFRRQFNVKFDKDEQDTIGEKNTV